jgi:CubicO group peptidase (beta-lactamase class C family)
VARGSQEMTMRRIGLAFSMLVVCAASVFAQSKPLPSATPESVGFDAERLKRLNVEMRKLVDAQEFAGIVTFMARHGKVVNSDVYGRQDLAAKTPMQRDTIFRIYSMTKPITGVAMMILYEAGKWHPDDPLSKYIPEFASLKVYAGTNADGSFALKAPARAPTVGMLMSHIAGFSYGIFGNSPVDRLYQSDNPLGAPSLKEFIAKLSKLPLLYEPGDQWVYSVSVDIQGYLVEKLSGQTLPDFMRTRIFEPLGMTDTGFTVPQNKLSRLATVYEMDAKAHTLQPQRRDPDVSVPPGLPSGGGGLYSTANDYLRFAQMLANGGELDGVRILAPATIALMRDNHLPASIQDAGSFGIGLQHIRPGLGFGYDVAVFDDPHKAGSTTGKGTYLWDGAAGTWFWVDPTNDIVFVGMIQRMATTGIPNAEQLSRVLVDQALIDSTR